MVEKDIPNLVYERCRNHRLYHLDFDVIVTASHEGDLLDIQERVARFYQLHSVMAVENRGLSTLRRSSPWAGCDD